MIIKKNHFLNITAFIILIALIGMRPMLFGEINTFYASVFILGFILFLGFIYKFKRDIKIDILFYGSFILFWFLILILGSLGTSNIAFLIKAFLANIFTVVSICYFLLSNKELLIKFTNSLIYLLALLGISSVVSSAFFLVMSIDSLLMFELDMGYPKPSKVIFPFSILYHEMTVGGIQILRYQSIFRESGISQAFYIWAIVISIYMLKNKWIVLCLFCGLATSFSTASIALTLLIIPIALFTNRSFKKSNSNTTLVLAYFFAIFIVPILFYFAYFFTYELPYIGVNSKLLTHSNSINDRLPNIEEITLLGSGIYSSDIQNSAINLLKGSTSLGLILTLFYMYFFTLMCWLGTSKGQGLKIFICLLPIFLTSLLSQPLVDAPFLYLLLYITRAAPWTFESITNEYETKQP